MLRELISKFNRSLSRRLVDARRSQSSAIRIWFDPDPHTSQTPESVRATALLGETIDLSRSGVGFMVNAIRINEKYIAGHSAEKINVEIDLPSGRVYMQLIGKRYERTNRRQGEESFFVGAAISRIDPESIAAYDHFLRYGDDRTIHSTGSELGLNTDQS